MNRELLGKVNRFAQWVAAARVNALCTKSLLAIYHMWKILNGKQVEESESGREAYGESSGISW